VNNAFYFDERLLENRTSRPRDFTQVLHEFAARAGLTNEITRVLIGCKIALSVAEVEGNG
jgi:hypothetical protein